VKAEELREATDEELQEKEVELRRELFNLRFQLATAQIENPMRVRVVKKDIARIKTILRERRSSSSGN
jgi:large subunit ribosomal protein L29